MIARGVARRHLSALAGVPLPAPHSGPHDHEPRQNSKFHQSGVCVARLAPWRVVAPGQQSQLKSLVLKFHRTASPLLTNLSSTLLGPRFATARLHCGLSHHLPEAPARPAASTTSEGSIVSSTLHAPLTSKTCSKCTSALDMCSAYCGCSVITSI